MKRTDYIPPSDWQGARTIFEDEYGNRGEVRWPRLREAQVGRITSYLGRWEDAEVRINSGLDGSADDAGAVAEFILHLAHVAKTLDLAFAEDKAEFVSQSERAEQEREQREAVRARAIQMRCEELAQFYMQLVRVQREGHSSHAKGELNVTMVGEGDIRRQMWLRESNGNRWTFEANAVAKFEVKDGNRYIKIKLTPMSVLEKQAELEVVPA